MKRSVSYKLLPLLPVATGLMTLLLRLGLYTMENESGLLPHNHPFYIATLILAVSTAAVVLIFAVRLKGPNGYAENFPHTRWAASGSLAAGLLLGTMALSIWQNAENQLDQIWAILAFSAAFCLLITFVLLLLGKKPHFLPYFVVCLYFILHMVCQYREWSGNPQVEDYIFSLFGCIFLALFAYYRAAFCLGLGRRRTMLFCGMMVLFFSLPMTVSGGDRLLFLAGFVWVSTNLCVIDPPAEAPKEF